jgi:SNF2 family DNA or RNA helicase
MSEFFVQRTREDAGIHIPPPAVRIYRIDKDKVKYKKQYEAEHNLKHKAALVLENGDVQSMLYILEIILRERQCMTWPAGIVLKDPETKEIICNFDVEESQKLDEAVSLLQDLIDEEERVIVFSKFKAPLYEMRRRFPDEPMVVATGDQSTNLRNQVVRDFDLKTAPESPRWKVAFATYDAFATGLNLNAARHVIMLDDEWSPGMEDQAIGRIDRLNSTDQANVHIFRVNDSIDDFMESLLNEKKQLTEGFESTLSAADLLKHLRSD